MMNCDDLLSDVHQNYISIFQVDNLSYSYMCVCVCVCVCVNIYIYIYIYIYTHKRNNSTFMYQCDVQISLKPVCRKDLENQILDSEDRQTTSNLIAVSPNTQNP